MIEEAIYQCPIRADLRHIAEVTTLASDFQGLRMLTD